MKKFSVRIVIDSGTSGKASDILADQAGLPRSRVKDAMNKGAVWLKSKKGGLLRLRRATCLLRSGDIIELYYDEKLLSLKPPLVKCMSDLKHYSSWYKPSGLLSQGTKYGDHCSLMRQAELFFRPLRKVFLVHRLDREASGIMLLAHNREAAAKLSELFRKNQVIKRYRAEVLGDIGSLGLTGTIEFPLDGRQSLTEYEVESYNPADRTSSVTIVITTGRLHQIRRHFDMIGFPVIGDSRYGTGNKNIEGMKLTAAALKFRCPFSNRDVEFTAQ